MFLETKGIKTVRQYDWHRMSLFTRWLPRTNQLVIVFFGASAYLKERIPEILSHPETENLADPFWVYSRLFTEVARLEDEAVWAMRDMVRDKEKKRVSAGRAQPDSAAIKTVAFVTLAFLPPTFVSAIFSMSFFSFSSDSGWIVSDKFWLYWVFSVPITLVSILIWYCWQDFKVPLSLHLNNSGRAKAETIESAPGSGWLASGLELERVRSRAL